MSEYRFSSSTQAKYSEPMALLYEIFNSLFSEYLYQVEFKIRRSEFYMSNGDAVLPVRRGAGVMFIGKFSVLC